MKPSLLSSISILVLLLTPLSGQIRLPVPDQPSSWVNDYAGIFSADEKRLLEEKLGRFEYNTSTQIFLVTLSDNEGYAASDLAPQIGELWGVGQQGRDNGLIILMDMMDRQVFISTGYGLEEYIPDAIASRIVHNEILPRFREGNFFEGINSGIDVMISLLEGSFTPDEYMKQSGGTGASVIGIFIAIMIFMAIFGGSRRRSVGIGSRNIPLLIALGMLNSGSRHSGSFGSFSSGRGGFGGGFGGFSGGGGGSFGGGGAGGGW